MKTIVCLLLALLLSTAPSLGQGVTPPSAAMVAVSYSDPEEIYGWCASDGGDAFACANQQCMEGGGTECVDTISCRLDYTFIAFTRQGARGVGAACDSHPTLGRLRAIVSCMNTSHALCWTAEAIALNGDTIGADDNLSIDRRLYAQLMLQRMGLTQTLVGEVDDPRLGDEIRAFQRQAAVPETGEADTTTIEAMLAIMDGEQGLAATIKENTSAIYEGGSDIVGQSSEPSPLRTFVEEIDSYEIDRQGRTLGVFLNFYGYACPPPAEMTLRGDNFWIVICNGTKSYSVSVTGDDWRVTPDVVAVDTTTPPSKVAPHKEKRG